MSIEFFNCSKELTGEETQVKINGEYKKFSELTNTEVNDILDYIKGEPRAFKALIFIKNIEGITDPRKMLKAFIDCNWANLDSTSDITDSGHLNYELVNCSKRLSCKVRGIKCLKSE